MMTPNEFLNNLDFEKFQDIIRNHTIIKEEDWKQELTETPSTYAYLAAVMETARKRVDIHKQALLEQDANFRAKKRAEMGKISESRLNTEVYLDETYKDILVRIQNSEEKHGWLKAIVQAIRYRHECLVQLSANARKETELYK